MGRIKTTLIKRTSRTLIKERPESFSENFDYNKLKIKKLVPSKRMRNGIAGYISRLKKKKTRLK
jgi:ribosomal protein S17E